MGSTRRIHQLMVLPWWLLLLTLHRCLCMDIEDRNGLMRRALQSDVRLADLSSTGVVRMLESSQPSNGTNGKASCRTATFQCTEGDVLDGKASCNGIECNENDDLATCCKQRAPCDSVVWACPPEEFELESGMCAGPECNMTSDLGRCCKPQAKCVTFEGTCEAGEVLNETSDCATSTCKQSDSTTCCKPHPNPCIANQVHCPHGQSWRGSVVHCPHFEGELPQCNASFCCVTAGTCSTVECGETRIPDPEEADKMCPSYATPLRENAQGTWETDNTCKSTEKDLFSCCKSLPATWPYAEPGHSGGHGEGHDEGHGEGHGEGSHFPHEDEERPGDDTMCNEDYQPGNVKSNVCKNSTHELTNRTDQCKKAALDSGVELGDPFEIPLSDWLYRPKGCYVDKCSPESTTNCFWYNPAPVIHRAPSTIKQGIAVCRRARYLMGLPVNSSEPWCPSGYNPIMEEEPCRVAGRCMGFAIPAEFRKHVKNATEWLVFPPGCFVHESAERECLEEGHCGGERDQGKVFFNPPNVPSGWGKPTRPKGTPICKAIEHTDWHTLDVRR